ncbi:MAG: hypothetical protein UY79_C0012G0001, partial [Parcubacteria group bacterium GW2011_GWA2_53_21]
MLNLQIPPHGKRGGEDVDDGEDKKFKTEDEKAVC